MAAPHPHPVPVGTAAPGPRPHLPAGTPVVRRDQHHLQVGIDPPRRAVLPDTPDVRRLLADLGGGRPPRPQTDAGHEALHRLGSVGLLDDAERAEARAAGRGGTRVGLDVPADLRPALTRQVGCVGLAVAPREEATVVLVAADGQLPRDRLDDLVRDGVPHLVLATEPHAVALGPFVRPGASACLRCVDAHHAVADPRRALLVEQAAATAPVPRHPALHPLALAWAVADLLAWAEGRAPGTWSATVRISDDLAVRRTPWSRHPGCGCAWGVAVSG